MRTFITFFLIIPFTFLLNSCDKNRVYEENKDIPEMNWNYNETAKFEFEINDNIPKNVLVNLRHSFHYGWRNIWLKTSLTFPNDSIYEFPLNIELSQPNGKWFGKCTGDICFYQYSLPEFSNYSFVDTGIYSITIAQDMRQNPLPNVMSIGVRVENAIEKP
jgi:gliding motility-associated lipoprotein GldH